MWLLRCVFSGSVRSSSVALIAGASGAQPPWPSCGAAQRCARVHVRGCDGCERAGDPCTNNKIGGGWWMQLKRKGVEYYNCLYRRAAYPETPDLAVQERDVDECEEEVVVRHDGYVLLGPRRQPSKGGRRMGGVGSGRGHRHPPTNQPPSESGARQNPKKKRAPSRHTKADDTPTSGPSRGRMGREAQRGQHQWRNDDESFPRCVGLGAGGQAVSIRPSPRSIQANPNLPSEPCQSLPQQPAFILELAAVLDVPDDIEMPK